MPSSSDLEKKIKLFGDVEDIVNAMRAYAGVMIRKTEDAAPNVREYENTTLLALSDLTDRGMDPPFAQQTRGKRVLIAFGSTQGLCGPYNRKIADAVSQFMSPEDTLFVIGRRLKASVDAKSILHEYCPNAALSINAVKPALKDMLSRIREVYRGEAFYNLTCIFTVVFENKATISAEQILPPDLERAHGSKQMDNRPLTYLDPHTLFQKTLEEFLYISLFRAYIESLRSENWYRMKSMEGASEILKKSLSELAALQNYTKQEEITEEMLEILNSGKFYKA